MRYFIELAYKGTHFCGWQVQPNAVSVQQKIEDVLAILLREKIEIVGCGRTDTGVHARYYVAHFDYEKDFPKNFIERANKLLGHDIVLKSIKPVDNAVHARFDAYSRSYEYHISFEKNPFTTETAWHFERHNMLNINDMQHAAEILRGYQSFAPFCKTNSDAQTMTCTIQNAEWVFKENKAVFYISANRFLRGMVRLIVGACINIGLGQMTLEDLKQALNEQRPLKKSYSVPPTGLYLVDVKYPKEKY
jgi:tRNA pseudouridine38-40 synthase